MLNPIDPQVIRSVAELQRWSRRRARGGPADRARADHGRAARGPPVAGAARLPPGRPRGGVDLREPHPVRAGRGLRALPARPRPRPRGAAQGRRRRRVRAVGRGDLPERRRDLGRRRAAHRGPVRPQPTRPLPRRHDRGGAALQRRAPARRGLRREGLPAARGDPPDGARSRLRDRGRRRADRARARRPRDELAQRVPLRARTPAGDRAPRRAARGARVGARGRARRGGARRAGAPADREGAAGGARLRGARRRRHARAAARPCAARRCSRWRFASRARA